MCTLWNGIINYRSLLTSCVKPYSKNQNNNRFLAEVFNKTTDDIQKLSIRYNKIQNYDINHIINVMNVCTEYQISGHDLYNHPNLFGFKSSTLQNHADLLLECGISQITPLHLKLFISIVTRYTIGQLKNEGFISENVDVQQKLLNCLHSWPTSPAMSKVYYNDMTLHKLRMKILARYLELNIDLPQEEFEKKVTTYPRIKYRPFKLIDQLLDTFQHKIRLSNKKLCSHFGIFQAHPVNVNDLLENITCLSGISLRDFILDYPGILLRKWENVSKIQATLNDYNISYEAQRKCPKIFSLDYNTVVKRIEDIKKIPEFQSFIHHPKIVKLIYSKNRADMRLEKLKEIDKTCHSINVLTGCEEHYCSFIHSQGDLNRGRDAKSIIQSLLDNKYSYNEIRQVFKQVGCLNVVPLNNFKKVHENLKHLFNAEAIFNNCHILLFPWDSINKYLQPLLILKAGNKVDKDIDGTNVAEDLMSRNIDVTKLTMSSILSLVLYYIEKEYNFTGGGIWNLKKVVSKSNIN